MFPLLDIPVETTECGMQTKWDDGNGNGRCNGNGRYHGDSDGDGVNYWCDSNGDGTRYRDASAAAMGNVRSYSDSDGANIDALCNDGNGDGMRDGDALVTAMDGLTATVVECAMTTALNGNDDDSTATAATDGSTVIEEVEDYDGICFMTVKIMDAFICRGTSHAAKCASPLVSMQRKAHFCGSMLREIWKFQCCGKELVFDNQHMVRSDVVAEGAHFSRLQPKINLDIVKGAKLEGIPHEQMLGLFRCMGIYVGKSSNMLKQATKVEAAIKHTFEERLIENQKEHVTMTHADKNYRGDVVWEKDRTIHSTCSSSSDVCNDGAGCTRSYNHRHQGKQSAFIVNSIMTGKPLALVVSKVSNIDDDSVASKLLSYLTISLSMLDILYSMHPVFIHTN
jgi:hypothetical protein